MASPSATLRNLMHLLGLKLLALLPMHMAIAQVQIIAYEIPGLLQQDKTGAYDKVLHKALVDDKLATLSVYPPARADYLFRNCQNCCVTPGNNNPDFYDFGEEVQQTEAINTARIYIFSPPGTPPYSSLSELKDKVTGTRFGMPYGAPFEAMGLKILQVSELQEHISLMKRGHIDAFIAYAPDVYDMFRKLNIEPYPHNTEQPYDIHPDSMMCRSVSDKFLSEYNQKIRAMRESGELAKMLGEKYLPPLNTR